MEKLGKIPFPLLAVRIACFVFFKRASEKARLVFQQQTAKRRILNKRQTGGNHVRIYL